jgi:hypothetical protein
VGECVCIRVHAESVNERVATNTHTHTHTTYTTNHTTLYTPEGTPFISPWLRLTMNCVNSLHSRSCCLTRSCPLRPIMAKLPTRNNARLMLASRFCECIDTYE